MVDSDGLSKHAVFATSDLYLSPVQTVHVVPSPPYPALHAAMIYSIYTMVNF